MMNTCFQSGGGGGGGGGDGEDGGLEVNIPGIPGQDYPIYAQVHSGQIQILGKQINKITNKNTFLALNQLKKTCFANYDKKIGKINAICGSG